jgi:hypothetical protein
VAITVSILADGRAGGKVSLFHVEIGLHIHTCAGGLWNGGFVRYHSQWQYQAALAGKLISMAN